MKVYVRNRNKHYGDPFSWFPFQAALWFKPEEEETWRDAQTCAAGFSVHLKREHKWSSGALGRMPGIIDTRDRGGDSTGILFNHRDFAQEAKAIYLEWSKARQ